MEKKFCSFCAEPHIRKQSTCSEECSTELIRTEFEENGEVGRRCLWCSVRGDLAPFKHANCCASCASKRAQNGACKKCGGPFDLSDTCFRCEKPEAILKKHRLHRAYILWDKDTCRARKHFTSSAPWDKFKRYVIPIIPVTRRRIERPATSSWEEPTSFCHINALTGTALKTRVQKLKSLLAAGPKFTLSEWADLYMAVTQSSQESSARYFERAKFELREWGVRMDRVKDHAFHYYEPDLAAVEALLTYYKTAIKNREMGYYW